MIRLPQIFSDGAVLQRRAACAFWGWADERALIEVKVGDQPSVMTIASSGTGRFMVHLPVMEASGPHTITVTDRNSGETLTRKDIYFGEVYLASGQSNMEFLMRRSPRQMEEALRTNTPERSNRIRFFNVKQNAMGVEQEDCEGSWLTTTDENLGICSAVGYQFAKALHAKLDVAVGILNSSWGGTRIQAWISPHYLRKDPRTAGAAREMDFSNNDPCYWENRNWDDRCVAGTDDNEYFQKYCTIDPGNEGYEQGFASSFLNDRDRRSWRKMEVPGDWLIKCIGGHGSCWFRKKITIPAGWAGKDLSFHFCIADKHDIVYFNNEEIGRTGKDFEYVGENRLYTVPGRLVKEGENLIAIRLYSFAFGGGFYGSSQSCYLALADGKEEEKISIAGEWLARMEREVPEPPPVASCDSNNVPGNPQACGGLYNGMIRPLLPFALAGVLWYQGETNAGILSNAREYEFLLADLANGWREMFRQENLPFFVVSLAGFHEPSEYTPTCCWAPLRESQRRVANALPDFYIAPAHDLGEANDIHPQDKKSVGERLARLALYHLYGEKASLPAGPEFAGVRREGNTLRLRFTYAKGLHTTDGKAPSGFYIAGTAPIYYKADAVIEGEEVVLSSAEVKDPSFVRYGWSDYPIINLVNEEGLPALPFEA